VVEDVLDDDVREGGDGVGVGSGVPPPGVDGVGVASGADVLLDVVEVFSAGGVVGAVGVVGGAVGVVTGGSFVGVAFESPPSVSCLG